MKVMLWSETCLTGKIATLAFGASVAIAPQWKQKGNACAVKKWRGFAILIFRVYLSWVKQWFYRNYRSSRTEVFCWKGVLRNFAMNYSKFLRTSFFTEHLRWLLLELTHNLMISISICFCNQSWFQNPCHMFQTSKNSQKNTCAGVLFNMRLQRLQRRCFPVNFAKFL